MHRIGFIGLGNMGRPACVDEFRVFYDVLGQEVQVLAIVSKTEAAAWLAASGDAQP